MSYPRKLQVLVIEDDPDTIRAHKESIAAFAKKYVLDAHYASSYEDAKRCLDGNAIFHVVIVDLNLPVTSRGLPAADLAPGEQLIEELAKRDAYPVPVVLVVSGRLNEVQPLGALNDRLCQDFWYGRLINKGLEQEHEIEEGLRNALRYVDVGVHVRDSEGELFPTLSPREEDLLRRCVLADTSRLGVDLRWWSAESGASASHPSPNRGPTKILMGAFIMDSVGLSIPTFFKFEPAGNASSVRRDATILSQKLSHIKVFHAAQSRQRSLIVTQSATNRGVPIPFSEYLRRDAEITRAMIPKLIAQVSAQLEQLGDATTDAQVPVPEFFWEYLDLEAMEKTWRQAAGVGLADALGVFDLLKASPATVWATRRNCNHGDLNATNIAIDADSVSNPQAYIFDAAGIRSDFKLRDLATLEVTTILFNSPFMEDQFETCKTMYEGDFLPDANSIASLPIVTNVLSLIRAVRSQVTSDADRLAYALLVFDTSLRQLFGLAIQPSPNKVRNPMHACALAAWIAEWLAHIAPNLLPELPNMAQNGAAILRSVTT